VGGNGGSPLEVAHSGTGLMDRGQMETGSEEGPNEGLCPCECILHYSLRKGGLCFCVYLSGPL
jgi:hypothetical protein